MNDYELVYLAQENNEIAKDILYNKYKRYIDVLTQRYIKKYELNKLQIEDINLECQLVFEKVVDSYNQDKDVKFSTYLYSCIENKLKDIIRSNSTKKTTFYNQLRSLEEEQNGIKLSEIVYNDSDLIEHNIIENKIIDYDKLSSLEGSICNLLIKEYTPEEISKQINIDIKKVYNTIYRIRTKIKEQLVSEEG